MLRFHAEHGLRSFLHVAAENLRAVSLYMHLGFAATAPMHFRQLQRVSQ
jgi:ribosomal protein S18 acetylase RimI-like enzyme